MEKVQQMRQAEDEALPQAIERALTVMKVTEGKLGRVQLTERSFGCTVLVDVNDTMESVVERLNAEYRRRMEAGEIEPPRTQGVPSSEDEPRLPWAQFHPTLKEIVIAKLCEEVETLNGRIAREDVLHIAMQQSAMETFGPMAPWVSLGGTVATGAAQRADYAIRAAYEAAILFLGGEEEK